MTPFELASLALQLWQVDKSNLPIRLNAPGPKTLEPYYEKAFVILKSAEFYLEPKSGPRNDL